MMKKKKEKEREKEKEKEVKINKDISIDAGMVPEINILNIFNNSPTSGSKSNKIKLQKESYFSNLIKVQNNI